MRTKFIIIVAMAMFSLSSYAQTDAVKPVLFNVEKTIVNSEKLISQDLTIQLKGNILENIEGDYYWIQDETGRIKAKISQTQISELGSYDSTSIFYIIGKLAGERDSYLEVTEIKKP